MKRKRFQLSSGLILRDCAPGCSGEFAGAPLDAKLDAPIVVSRPKRSRAVLFDAKRASSAFTPEWRGALAAGGVLFCPACRSRNRPRTRFCAECGVEISSPPRPRRRTAPRRPAPPKRGSLPIGPLLVGLLFILACGAQVMVLGS